MSLEMESLISAVNGWVPPQPYKKGWEPPYPISSSGFLVVTISAIVALIAGAFCALVAFSGAFGVFVRRRLWQAVVACGLLVASVAFTYFSVQAMIALALR